MIHKLILFCLMILFTGCITKELPAYTTYTIDQNIKTKPVQNTKESIYVHQPRVTNSLNSTAMIYSKAYEKNAYALSKWSDKPSIMIQHLMANSLDQSKAFKLVVTAKQGLETSYDLKSELLQFEQRFLNEESFAHMKIKVILEGQTVKAKTFEYLIKTSSNDAKGGVEAFNAMMKNFSKDLLNWLN